MRSVRVAIAAVDGFVTKVGVVLLIELWPRQLASSEMLALDLRSIDTRRVAADVDMNVKMKVKS